MKHSTPESRTTWALGASRLVAISGLTLLAAAALASPVTYQAAVMTDVSLGGKAYHNADVTITLRGDTSDLTHYSVTAPDGQTGSGLMISKGRASVTVTSLGKSVTARFAPGQLFVSVDSFNGGIGFGSLIGPNGIEPGYPLAFTDGTAQSFAYNNDLSTQISLSGKAWSCVGYPPVVSSGKCTEPDPYPLKTDKGSFVIYQPYVFLDGTQTGNIMSDYSGTMNRGTFAIIGH